VNEIDAAVDAELALDAVLANGFAQQFVGAQFEEAERGARLLFAM
jgi:hypothetical protein